MTYNKKSLSPVISFLVWLVVFAIICLIGITNVFAATYDATTYTAQLYDNYGPSLHDVSTEFTNMSWRGTIPNMQANTSGAAWGVSSPIPILKNHTYSMTIKIEGNFGGNLVLSTFNRIGLGTSLANAKSSYENNTNSTLEYSNVVSASSSIQFAFTSSINANYIVFPFATNYTGDFQSFYLYNLIIEDLGSSSDVSQTTINNSLNNQTIEINTSITNSENNIKGSIKESENNIKDGIKEGFESCRDSYNLLNVSSNLTITGSKTINSVNLDPGTYTLSAKEIISTAQSQLFLLYLESSQKYIYLSSTNLTTTFSIDKQSTKVAIYSANNYDNSVNTTTTFKNLMLQKGSVATSYEEYGKQVCKNRIDETNDNLKDLNDSINDSSAPDLDFGDVAGWLPAGPVDSLINLPLTLFTNLTSSLNKTCQSISVPIPFLKQNVSLPCMSSIYAKIDGFGSWFNGIGVVVSAFILFSYLLKLYKWVDDTLTFRENNHIDNWGGV